MHSCLTKRICFSLWSFRGLQFIGSAKEKIILHDSYHAHVSTVTTASHTLNSTYAPYPHHWYANIRHSRYFLGKSASWCYQISLSRGTEATNMNDRPSFHVDIIILHINSINIPEQYALLVLMDSEHFTSGECLL